MPLKWVCQSYLIMDKSPSHFPVYDKVLSAYMMHDSWLQITIAVVVFSALANAPSGLWDLDNSSHLVSI